MKQIILLLALLLTTRAFSRDIVLTSKNTVILNEQFNAKSTAKVIKDVYGLVKDGPTLLDAFINQSLSSDVKEIFLVLDTPGGSIEAGLEMIDVLNAIPNLRLHTVTKFAASMGFVTSQLLKGNRYITPHGVLMSHLAYGPGFEGSFPNGTMDSMFNFYQRRLEMVDEEIVKRTSGIHTIESYRKLINQDYWGTGLDNKNHGFVDDVANIYCSKDLLVDEITTLSGIIFGRQVSLKVKRSKCPLIAGVEIVESEVDGFKYDKTDPLLNEKLYLFVKETVGKHQQVR